MGLHTWALIMIIIKDDGSFIKICNCKYGDINCSCEQSN